jgi:hypothetical protein
MNIHHKHSSTRSTAYLVENNRLTRFVAVHNVRRNEIVLHATKFSLIATESDAERTYLHNFILRS